MRLARWECDNDCCLNKTGWWVSVHGVVNCLNCVPPASEGLVAVRGTAEDAPMVRTDQTRVPASQEGREAVSDPRAVLMAGGSFWILRGNRTPQKVEARQRRRKTVLPPDATHWCREGDPTWTPIDRKTRESFATPAPTEDPR